MNPTSTRKKIYISEDDPDDQFIFRTACSEIDKDLDVVFFYKASDLILQLCKLNREEVPAEDLPRAIIGDLKIPFFELKDISEIRMLQKISKVPLCVFAESFSDFTKGSALDRGANFFHHKPDSLQQLRLIIKDLIGVEPVAEPAEQVQSA